MPSRVDLHTHTTASDGTLTPGLLFDLAIETGLRVLAITDHDSTAGYEIVAPLAAHHPNLRVIPAIEMNAEGEFACHLLGYFIDPTHSELQKRLSFYRELRLSRVRRMVEKLNALDVKISFDRVVEISAGGSVGRPHIADAMLEKGIVKNRQQAFDRYLKKDGPAYITCDEPKAEEVITLLRRAGGIPVLAHPSYYMSDGLLDGLVRAGLMGIEAYYPDHGRSLTRRYVEMAHQRGLVVTGGSDFHGPRTGRAALASVEVPETVVDELEKARVI